MSLPNFSVNITMHKTERRFLFQNKTVLSLSIVYPQANLLHNPVAQIRINRRIQAQVNDFYRYVSQNLYEQAVENYKNAMENGFPFHPFEAVLQYEITYNQHCRLSLYHDQYEFTGGAHGNTTRFSDTWDVKNGQVVPLSSFFLPEQDYRAFLIQQIIQQADQEMQQNPGIYFEDYPALITEHFNPDNYYLTPSGVAIYYQQYDIAPYSTGIVVFTIPYETLQWWPYCMP